MVLHEATVLLAFSLLSRSPALSLEAGHLRAVGSPLQLEKWKMVGFHHHGVLMCFAVSLSSSHTRHTVECKLVSKRCVYTRFRWRHSQWGCGTIPGRLCELYKRVLQTSPRSSNVLYQGASANALKLFVSIKMCFFFTVSSRVMPSHQSYPEAPGPTRSPPSVTSREEHSDLDSRCCWTNTSKRGP